MHYKIYIKFWALSIVLVSMIIMTFNYIVDPFHQYRVETFYPVHYSNTRYKNAGFSKNYNYDSIIIGTSMSQNFIISETERILKYNKLLKLCIAGATAKEESTVLNTVFENNDKLKNVLFGLDIYSFLGDPQRLRHGEGSFPMHLYDNNYFNDYKYLLSLDTIIKSLQAISFKYLKNSNDIRFQYDYMDQWQHLHVNDFKIQNVINRWHKRRIDNYEGRNIYNELVKSFNYNFLELIKKNSHIKFKIFYPPYTILSFKSSSENGILEDMLKFKEYIYSEIGDLENVEIYDFQIEDKITHNLNNYKDLTHYKQDINTWMLKNISKREYIVTEENYKKNTDILINQIDNLNFSKISDGLLK